MSSSSSLNESTIKPFYKYLGIRKPIVKLKILPVLDRLLCICDKTLLSLDSASLELLNNLKIRNVQTFCQNQNPISDDPFQIELCLARSKSLEIVSIRSDRISVIKEVSVVEQPISVSMDGDYICMASPNHYFILNWQTNSSQVICESSGDMIFPICKFVSRNEFLISTPSYLGVFIKTSAISERPPIDWGPNVLQIVYSYPYVLCMKIHSISIIRLVK